MTYLLDEIFNSASVQDEKGNRFDLHSHTSKAQCLFLDEIIRDIKPQASLEIGLAYGISTLQILRSMSDVNRNFTHIVMDPFQREWNNIGELNIERSGFGSHVKFFPEFSNVVLPRLCAEKTRIQFAYIDSTKVFDQLMVDVHYIERMLDVGGVLVLDDCDFPGIRLLARFLARHPSFRVFKGLNADMVTFKGRVAEGIASMFVRLTPFRKRKLSRFDTSTDASLGINFKCVAFRKIADDTRPWNWHQAF